MPTETAVTAPRQGEPGGNIRAELNELLRLAGPVVVARLGIMTMGLTDAIVVGHYSSEQLAFHALGWAPTAVMLTTAVGLLVGVQVMAARCMGAGRPRDAGAVLRRGLVYSFWIGVVSMAGMLVLGPMFLHNIGLEQRLAEGATLALLVFSLSLPTYLVSVAATFWLEALSRPGPGMWAMWAANLVNLALCLVLVPGGFGIPAMGAVGAAWATFGSRLALVVVVLVYIARMKDARELGVFDKPSDGKAPAVEQRRIGYGAGASYFVEGAAFAGMNFIAGWIGALAVAGWAVVLNVAAIIFMVPLGLASATAVQVGRAHGARDPGGMVRAGLLGFGVAAAFGTVVALIVWPGAEMIVRAYTSDPALVALARGALVLACLFFAADAVQVVVAQALRARGDVLVPTITHVISYALVMLPLGYVFAIPMGMGLDGIVWGPIVASLLAAVLLFGRFWLLGKRGR